MSLTDTLIRMGYTLPGQDPNIITEEGGAPHAGASGDRLTTIARALAASAAQEHAQKQERQVELRNQMSTYQTLRDNGYSPAKAHEIVLSGQFPKDIPEIPGISTKDQSVINKNNADTSRINAETEKIKKQTEILGTKKANVESDILAKIANGEDLTEGEQKIYDEVIKKKNTSLLAEIVANQGPDLQDKVDQTKQARSKAGKPKAEATPKEDPNERVKVIAPDGRRGTVPRKNLQKLVAKGYKVVE